MSRPQVVVLDYGSGNLRSAERALARVGADVRVTSDLQVAAECAGLVVPGVGAYAACMAGINEVGAGPVIRDRVVAGRPVLGICVGMQVLFDEGFEHGVHTPGLGLLPGVVARLEAPVLPHMGWNTVEAAPGSVLFESAAPDARYYFVHSYAATDVRRVTQGSPAASTPGARVTTAEHGILFAAAVETGADGAPVLAATQFHPEKSGDAGALLLSNWVGMLR